jgi:predicted enzyme related to lactoylglutathione lyase
MGEPVVYFEILGTDGAGLREFYERVMGWEIEPVESSGGAYQRVRGAGLEGGIGAFDGAPSQVSVYVGVKDPAAVLEKVKEAGGRVVMEPREALPGLTVAMFADPEDHVIGLITGLDK